MEDLKGFIASSVANEEEVEIKKVDILFDLAGESYQINDMTCLKQIVCICGTCDVVVADKITSLNKQGMSIDINKGANAEIINYSNDVKLAVTYFEEKES